MHKQPTNEKIAASYDLWCSFYDVNGFENEEDFNKRTFEDRLAEINKNYPENETSDL